MDKEICILLTSYYASSDEDRNRVNVFCLEQNLKNPLIGRVILLCESSTADEKLKQLIHQYHTKLIPEFLGIRPMFKHFFKLGNAILNQYSTCFVIIANSDIYFNETLSFCSEILKHPKKCIALTRWDLNQDQSLTYYNNYKSQDVWMYNSPMDENIGHYYMGKPSCDNKLLHEIQQLGFKISNPSLIIQSIHVHSSNFRTYSKTNETERVQPPYRYALPEGLVSPLKLIFFRMFSKQNYKENKYDLNSYLLNRYRHARDVSRNTLNYFNFRLSQSFPMTIKRSN